MIRLRTLWQNINSSLWFVPTLMVGGAMLLAYGLVIIDVTIGDKWVNDYPLLFGAGADGARGVLSAIAGSMMTVAALIFSLTLSTLAQVSNQYTPRVLRNFMGNRINQVVLGFFVSIFVYCLLVLRTIRGGDEGSFIPSLAVSGGLVLALVSIGVLVFFIHHMASSIQAANIVGAATEETEESIERLFPDELGEEADDAEEADLAEQAPDLTWVPVPAQRNGYVQSIDSEGMLELARAQQCIIRMEHGVGSFVASRAALVSVARYEGGAVQLDDELRKKFNLLFSLGSQRTITQDVGFGLRQVVDIALKALSPGVNDTTTSIICIDHLGSLIARLATCRLADPLRADNNEGRDRVRVITIRPSFASFAATAFDQIRVAGEGNVAVYLRLLTALATAAARTTSPSRRTVLRQHHNLIAEAATRTLQTGHEREQVRAKLAEAEKVY